MLYYNRRLYVPNKNSLKNLILDEFHISHYAGASTPSGAITTFTHSGVEMGNYLYGFHIRIASDKEEQ